MVLQTDSPEEAHKMNMKIRTIIITLIAAGSFATATIAPAVSQADPKSGSTPATCSGGGREGDEITVTVTVTRDGQSVSKSFTEKCESDGKWHVISMVQSPTRPIVAPITGIATSEDANG
jgi:hypothetical protein